MGNQRRMARRDVDPAAVAADIMTWLEGLYKTMEVTGLSRFGLTDGDIPAVVEKAQRASSMKGNPVPLTDEELASVLRKAL